MDDVKALTEQQELLRDAIMNLAQQVGELHQEVSEMRAEAKGPDFNTFTVTD